jgi:hypothetical protein
MINERKERGEMIETQMMNEKWYVSGSRLAELELKAKELERCKLALRMARAERDVYKDELNQLRAEQRSIAQATLRHISIAGNLAKQYGVRLLMKKLGIELSKVVKKP